MPIRHHATNLCDYLIKSDNGRFSLIGSFQNIHVRRFPAVKDPMGVVVTLDGSDGDPCRITLEGPDAQELLVLSEETLTRPVALPQYQQWSRTTGFMLTPMVFEKPGVYSVVIRSGDQLVHSFPFGVFERPKGDDEDEEGDSAEDQDA